MIEDGLRRRFCDVLVAVDSSVEEHNAATFFSLNWMNYTYSALTVQIMTV